MPLKIYRGTLKDGVPDKSIIMGVFSIATASRLQTHSPTARLFESYFYTKEIVAGRIRGALAIHQTEIKTEENKIHALEIFFKPLDSAIEIPLGFAAAPIRISPNLEEPNTLQKMKLLLRAIYTIQVLRSIDKRLQTASHTGLDIIEATSSVPHVKAVLREKAKIIYFRTGYPADTLAQFIEQLSKMSAEKIPLPQKRLLLLTVFKKLFTVLENLPRKSHGDFHPNNILVSIQHLEPQANFDQPIYTPSHIKIHVIDIGSLRNIISPNLKAKKLFYTKQDDLQTLFAHLHRWWSPQLNNLLGITYLTKEIILHMLEIEHKATQQCMLSTTVQNYQLQRLNCLLNRDREIPINYGKADLQAFSEQINQIYEVDEEGDGAPTVMMPYIVPAANLNK